MSECDEYTPTMDEILGQWVADAFRDCHRRPEETEHLSIGALRDAADRAIAAHDRALREEIAREVRADMFRGVRAWVERFSPGDRWDPQDALDLESALLGIVEANPDRSRARGEGESADAPTSKVLRYEVRIDDTAQRALAGEVVLVHEHRQGLDNRVEVWIRVADGETRTQNLRVFGTGQLIPAGWRSLGSCVAGPFVWHLCGGE